MKLLILSIALIFLVGCFRSDGRDLEEVSKDLISGSVPVVSTQELADTLVEKKVVILDARKKEEFEVSHMPDAIWVGFKDFDIERVRGIDPKTPIVVYCSVGYRSEKIGEKLNAAGYSDVKNLFGGLFAWANEGRPMIDQKSEATTSVHGYNNSWARYLSPELDVRLD